MADPTTTEPESPERLAAYERLSVLTKAATDGTPHQFLPRLTLTAADLDHLRTLLEWIPELADERDGHQCRQVWAENVLAVLLAREGGSTEVTPAEMVRATTDGSFMSSHDAATGNECVEFRVAKPRSRQQASVADGVQS